MKFWLEINLNRPVFRIRFILMRIRFRDNGSGTGSGSKIEQIPIFVLFFFCKRLKTHNDVFFVFVLLFASYIKQNKWYKKNIYILKKILFVCEFIYILKKILFVCEFITIFLSYPDPDTFPEVDPDPAKWYGSNRIRIRNTKALSIFNFYGLFLLRLLMPDWREITLCALHTLMSSPGTVDCVRASGIALEIFKFFF